MRLPLIVALVASAWLPQPAAARQTSPWEDWTDGDLATIAYRLKPSFPEQGPWILVRFYRGQVEPDGRTGWRARRLIYDVWSEGRDEAAKTKNAIASSRDCPAVRDAAEAIGRAVDVRIEPDGFKEAFPLRPPMTDGVGVTIAARVRERQGGAPITVSVSGNLDTEAAGRAFQAEAALKDCWKPA